MVFTGSHRPPHRVGENDEAKKNGRKVKTLQKPNRGGTHHKKRGAGVWKLQMMCRGARGGWDQRRGSKEPYGKTKVQRKRWVVSLRQAANEGSSHN